MYQFDEPSELICPRMVKFDHFADFRAFADHAIHGIRQLLFSRITGQMQFRYSTSPVKGVNQELSSDTDFRRAPVARLDKCFHSMAWSQ